MSVRSVLLASVCAALVLLPSAATGLAATPSKATLQLVDQGYKALNARDYAQAISAYSAAIESRQLPVETLANALLNRGLAHQRRNEFKKAIDDYTAAVGIDALDAKMRATALYNRALAYQSSNRPALAIEDFTGALFLDPKFAHAYYGRGNVLRDSGQYLFALSDFEKALRYNYPQAYLARFGEALTQEALNRPLEARRALMLVLAENPNFEPARKRLAALGGVVPTVPLVSGADATDDSDMIETSSVSQAGNSAEASPTLLEGSMKLADAGPDQGTETTVAIESRRVKTIIDRVPIEEDAPAGVQPAAAEEPAEKIVAVEPVPNIEEPVLQAEAPSEPVAAAEPAPKPALAPAAKVVPSPSKDVALSGWAVQISSQKDEKVAWSVWKKLKAKHEILADQKPVVMKADLGDRGIVYRLRLAGFDDQNSARNLCSKLKSAGVSCYVSKLNS
ncbi:MAG: tetratricopeptide repeat protein [Rhizobiales bacterium]|nr:tetratricopeptide repeat protein [Hyphomicrobiales bacterium]